jgi:hypothetical protein
MSRSGYIDDYDEEGRPNLWRANVERAIAGKRGQAFLREMAAALDAMPVKELVSEEIVRDSQHVCAMGSVALARGLDVSAVDPEDQEGVAKTFGIARSLVCEIAYENDEGAYGDTPSERWIYMRKWVDKHLRSMSE